MQPHNVVLLTNYIPPYRLPLFQALGRELEGFRVLQSVSMLPGRPWIAQHDGLDVETQKTLTFRRTWKHPHGFREQMYIQIPYDTWSRLYRLKPDVVLSDELGSRTAQAVAYRISHPNSRLIIWAALSQHTEQGRGSVRQILRRPILGFADAVLVKGASGAQYVKRFGVTDEKIFVTADATDHRRFIGVSLERSIAERRRLLYVGRLIELKGLALFLSTLSHWCREHPPVNVDFWLVGDGPERQALQKSALPPNLRLRFCGSVSFDDVPAFYAETGILVFPTLSDEWGLVVNEAMAAGLPVLGSVYSQAVEELVQDGVNGWAFRPNRSDEMYAALDRALVTPSDGLRQMGAAARRAVEYLTPEFTAKRMMDAIRFVSGEKQSGSRFREEVSLRSNS